MDGPSGLKPLLPLSSLDAFFRIPDTVKFAHVKNLSNVIRIVRCDVGDQMSFLSERVVVG